MLVALARETDMASMMTDSTLTRAYVHAASERKERGEHALGFSGTPGCRKIVTTT